MAGASKLTDAAGADTDELEQELAELVKETVVEAVQES
jgi:hypothetical protein